MGDVLSLIDKAQEGMDVEKAAEAPHLVLEELAQGLQQLELHPLGEPAHVVMALDRR